MGGSSGGRGSSVCWRPSSEDRLRDSTRGGADGFLCCGTLTGGSAAGAAASPHAPARSGFPTPLAMAALGGAGSWTASVLLPLALCCESPLTSPPSGAGASSFHRGGKEVAGVAEEGELAGELATLPRRPDTAWGFLDASCNRSNMARAL